MPQNAYDPHYGVLVMLPFIFSWIGLLLLPVILMVKDRRKLDKLNEICFVCVFGIQSSVLIIVFMAVNLLLVPFAYLKTILHKVLLLKSYKGRYQIRNLFIYVVLGLPFLICSQVTDVYHFVQHTFKSRQQKQ